MAVAEECVAIYRAIKTIFYEIYQITMFKMNIESFTQMFFLSTADKFALRISIMRARAPVIHFPWLANLSYFNQYSQM